MIRVKADGITIYETLAYDTIVYSITQPRHGKYVLRVKTALSGGSEADIEIELSGASLKELIKQIGRICREYRDLC